MCGWCVRANVNNRMCSHAFSVFEKAVPKCDPAYRSDYTKIYTFMMDVPLVRQCLTELDRAISSKPHDATIMLEN